MKKLPNAVKWLIIAVALALFAALAFAVNDRASRVEMPPPDDTFGIYRTAGSAAAKAYENPAAPGSSNAPGAAGSFFIGFIGLEPYFFCSASSFCFLAM